MPGRRTLRWTITLLCAVLLYLMGLGVRRSVLNGQYRAHGPELKFTLESALHFRRVQQLVSEGTLPRLDPAIEYPEGIDVRETDSVGSEYVQAAVLRLLPGGGSLMDRLRWVDLGWFCLGIPFLSAWILVLTGSRWAALLAGAFYAVAPSSVVRSTGQELSRENFALPLLIAHLGLEEVARRTSARRTALCAAASALLLAAALMTWDLIQFYLILWACAHAWRMLRGELAAPGPSRTIWLWTAVMLVAAGWLNPYLRAHDFLLSPAMLLVYGTGLGILMQRRDLPRCRKSFPVVLLVSLLPLLLGGIAASAYGEHYGHFSELLWAKLRFLNQKPADPSVLTFSQRIMWVPALHSATPGLTLQLFPWLLPLTIIGFGLMVSIPNDSSVPGRSHLFLFYIASLAAYILFVRFHVFVAIFGCALIGVMAGWALKRTAWLRVTCLALLLGGAAAEAIQTVGSTERWGRTTVYYRELDELTAWLAGMSRKEPVLANFGVSAAICAYSGCPILLHPKFESARIRERVEAYGKALFKGTEKEFRDWADELGAGLYVHSLGEFAEAEPRYQMRYFVDALEPPSDAVARLFEYNPDGGRYFELLWGNRKYRVFRLLTRDEEAAAQTAAETAKSALERGDLDQAESKAVEALQLDPRQDEAGKILQHVASLRNADFTLPVEQAP